MNTQTIDTQEPAQLDPKAALAAWMQRHGITVEFTRAGIRYSQESPKHRLTAQFHFVGTVRKGEAWESFEYSGGYLSFLGARGKAIIQKQAASGPIPSGIAPQAARIAGKLIFWHPNGYLDSHEARAAFEILYRHSEPAPESLLGCLRLDASGPDTFEEWAGEFGYDTDSRQAEATFRACQENSRKLLSLLGRNAFQELQELEGL